MVAALVTLVFSLISTVSNIITKVIFSTTAYFLVLIIQGLKVPGEATKGILEQAAETFRSVLEFVFGLIIELISTIISKVFDAIKDGIIESITSGSSAVGDIIEQTKTSFEGLLNDVPEITLGFSEMIFTLISDLWNNCMEALGYVQENA
ncbi:hypothetical protein BVRB_7g168040 [Beta vulgaris subsp. vulgaris]|uniref:Uncharacterized protein n=1 Tax=Beta vulgaris subsp. vulgaris TaxID=3555 RepID=A0A0J8BWN2_BETVV|nr:hypothetical protein BVRB_7g168040 [Beta vulgaris subsp. vulgaris]